MPKPTGRRALRETGSQQPTKIAECCAHLLRNTTKAGASFMNNQLHQRLDKCCGLTTQGESLPHTHTVLFFCLLVCGSRVLTLSVYVALSAQPAGREAALGNCPWRKHTHILYIWMHAHIGCNWLHAPHIKMQPATQQHTGSQAPRRLLMRWLHFNTNL